MDKSTLIVQAISRLKPNSPFSFTFDPRDPDDVNITWDDKTEISPPQSEIDKMMETILSEYSEAEYKRNREHEYPSMEEQADMQYWDQINGTTTWVDAISAIKNKYPKGVK